MALENGLNAKKMTKGRGFKTNNPHIRPTTWPCRMGSDGTPSDSRAWNCLADGSCTICKQDLVHHFKKHGNIFDLQVVGWKGLELLAKERGVVNAGTLKLPDLVALVAAYDDFANELSAVETTLRACGHFSIIGAECHSELAFIEHNWAELKNYLRPRIDDTDATLVQLIGEGLCAQVKGCTRVQANRKNARHCRDAMHAYRILRGEDGKNSVPPSSLAAAMTERKERHRVPWHAMTTALRAVADLPVTAKMLAKAKRVENLKAQQKTRLALKNRGVDRANRLCSRLNNRRYRLKKARESCAVGE